MVLAWFQHPAWGEMTTLATPQPRQGANNRQSGFKDIHRKKIGLERIWLKGAIWKRRNRFQFEIDSAVFHSDAIPTQLRRHPTRFRRDADATRRDPIFCLSELPKFNFRRTRAFEARCEHAGAETFGQTTKTPKTFQSQISRSTKTRFLSWLNSVTKHFFKESLSSQASPSETQIMPFNKTWRDQSSLARPSLGETNQVLARPVKSWRDQSGLGQTSRVLARQV